MSLKWPVGKRLTKLISIASLFIIAVLTLFVFSSKYPVTPKTTTFSSALPTAETANPQPPTFSSAEPTAETAPSPTNNLQPTTYNPIPTKPPLKILFGVGSQAGPALEYPLVTEAPVHMLTSWYNGPSDLEWMRIQQNDLIPRLYAGKYIVHLITWTDLPEMEIQTPHGPACGRPYPVSDQVVEDMKQLAQIYNGSGPMYVTLFTEFQTFTCVDNNWLGNENYFNTLQDNFKKIKDIFHQYAPRSKVALSWGGWQSTYDDPVNQGGRSLFPHFEGLMKSSDFNAFQSMDSSSNIPRILDMTRILGSYGKPIMLAHYKPANDSNAVFDADMRQLFTDEVMKKLTNNGLFAFSFMDYNQMANSDASYQIVKAGVQKYGK